MTITDDLIRDESLRLKPYRDSVGKLTIGVGRNLDDVGISVDEARLLLETDLHAAEAELDEHAPWWRDMTQRRQDGLLNMCFNMGWHGLSAFTHTLASLEAGDYEAAADNALASKWASQVGARATRIAAAFREG